MQYLVVYNNSPEEIEEIINRNRNLYFIFNIYIGDLNDRYFELFNEQLLFELLKGLYNGKTIVFEVIAINHSFFEGFDGIRIESVKEVQYTNHIVSCIKIEMWMNYNQNQIETDIYFGSYLFYQEHYSPKSKDERVKIVRKSIPKMGFIQAQSLGEMCSGCRYYNREGYIICAVHPMVKYKEVYNCPDFVLSTII